MGLFLRQHTSAVAISLLLHVAIVVLLTAGFSFSPRARVVSRLPVIETIIVDEALVEREVARLEALDRAEIAQREQEERDAREAADREQRRLAELRREREAAEQQRQVEVQQQREREAVVQRDREAADERERQRLAELQREREEEERLARLRAEEEERARLRAQADERQRRELEEELQRALAAEEERREAEEAGLLDEYVRLIENRIEQNWIRPASAVTGLECVVNVMQIPSGEVIDVRVGRCNGDDAVRRSIEVAVRRASPLPRPPVQALFERNLIVTFRPDV